MDRILTQAEREAARLEGHARECSVPGHCIEGLVDYLVKGWMPGGFLTAVLENDLMRAAGWADLTNQACLINYVRFLYTYAPHGAYGSPDRVKAWSKQGGLCPPEVVL